MKFLLTLGLLAAGTAHAAPDPQIALENAFRPGQALTIEGQPLFVEKIVGGKLILAPPAVPTATLGAFITPVDATASSAQEGRVARKMIDGSGWGESFPGSGVFIHTNNIYDGGSNMWNGAGNEPPAWLQFDLGKEFNVSGFYVWNYNEGNYQNRSAKEVEVLSSSDGKTFAPVGAFTFAQASGSDDDKGQAVAFKTPVKARYFKFDIKSNYKGNDVSGVAEVRFANADVKAPPPGLPKWTAKYARPQLQKPTFGAEENRIFPADMGLVDVTKAPYNAKGDGFTDDTASIQKALDDNPGRGAMIYLPNGVYLVSQQLRYARVGDDDNTIKNTVLQGQSRLGTIIRLKDAAPGFANPRKPRGIIWTGHAPAQRFGNELRNLTIDSGSDNVGACGLQFMANNQGGVYDVTIQSGDGKGAIGLDMAYTDENGPLFVKNVKVQGFDIGIATATSLASETMEHVVLENQNVAGFRNDGQAVSIRDLKSTNAVPAVIVGGGLVTLIDCDFKGIDDAATQTAISNSAGVLARNLKTSGYAKAIESKDGATTNSIVGPNVAEFRFPAPTTLLSKATTTLDLPIQETPVVPWDDLQNWVSPLKFGAKLDDGQDDSEAIQKAIDSGATTVYLPRGGYNIGKTIVIRGKVRRIIGGKAYFMVLASLKNQNAPLFRFEDGDAPVVVVERISTDFSDGQFYFVEHAAKRTLVLHALMVNFQGPDAYRNSGTGDLFIEDMVGQSFRFMKQNVWARQFNPELNFHPGTHVVNDGGSLWALGFKTEGGGTQIETRSGGKTEILGGLIGDTNAGKLAPMFVNHESSVSTTVVEVCFNKDPFDKIVEETRAGQTKLWSTKEALSGMRPYVYEGHE